LQIPATCANFRSLKEHPAGRGDIGSCQATSDAAIIFSEIKKVVKNSIRPQKIGKTFTQGKISR